ncbi:MAG: transposase [Opitutales bacterium]
MGIPDLRRPGLRTEPGDFRSNRPKPWHRLSTLANQITKDSRSVGIKGTDLVQTQCASIRLKLLKTGAVVVQIRRVVCIHLSQAYRLQSLFPRVHARWKPG